MTKSIYVLCGVLFFFSISTMSFLQFEDPFVFQKPESHRDLLEKTAFFLENEEKFDMVFLGDSRTFCGIHPHLIDSYTGKRSMNLSRFSHWFTTQIPQIRHLASQLRKDMVVVWSVGHQNFTSPSEENLPDFFPISLSDAFLLMGNGIHWNQVRRNLFVHQPLTQQFYRTTRQYRRKLKDWLERPLRTPSVVESVGLTISAQEEQVKKKYEAMSFAGAVNFISDQNKVTSLGIDTTGGAHLRVELDRSFFRKKQQELRLEIEDPDITEFFPDPDYVGLFEEGLKTFKENNITVIVNVIEEAPFWYHNPQFKKSTEEFLKNQIKPLVESFGFSFLYLDYSPIKPDDYFDYNHMNQFGVKKYSQLLGERLSAL